MAKAKSTPPQRELTAREQAFVAEYLVDLSAAAAARRAGYSQASSSRIAVGLMARPAIQARIAQAMEERAKRTKVNADWVIKRLEEQANADLADLFKPDGTLKRVLDWPQVWRRGLVSGIETDQHLTGHGPTRHHTTVRKIRLADRSKIIELIGRHVDVQAFKDKVDMSLSMDQMSDEELEARKAEAMARLATLKDALGKSAPGK